MGSRSANCKLYDPSPEQLSHDGHETMSLPPSGAPRSIATPCTKVCIVDGASGLCLGCFRTLSEIGGWSGLSDVERAEIMTELSGRRSRIDPAKLGG
jgi:predicted Fe-S protein YdhL (DUF1289 family)